MYEDGRQFADKEDLWQTIVTSVKAIRAKEMKNLSQYLWLISKDLIFQSKCFAAEFLFSKLHVVSL